jgi:hypothetical protein
MTDSSHRTRRIGTCSGHSRLRHLSYMLMSTVKNVTRMYSSRWSKKRQHTCCALLVLSCFSIVTVREVYSEI